MAKETRINHKKNISLYYQRADAGLEGLESYNGDIIPPACVLKQLASAFESGKNCGTIKDMISSSKKSSPSIESTSLGQFALNSFMYNEKGERLKSGIHDDHVFSFFQSILNDEVLTPSRRIGCFNKNRSISTMLSRDIRGAPPDCLVAKLAEIMGSFTTFHKMALFWSKFVLQLRRIWYEDKYVPDIPKDAIPDLNCCLVYQKLQVINSSLSRKKHTKTRIGLLESLEREDSNVSKDYKASNQACYAKLKTGEFVLRLGAKHPVGNLTLLETEEPIYAPDSQEGPLLTEDFIRENEELILRTGSVGIGCSKLLSDMQAFKAANPGCILEDFVRWYSPPDWSADSSDDGEFVLIEGSRKGHLSIRMQKEGNLWHKLWENSKPVPAVRQVPLFDVELAVEGLLFEFENISPSSLFKQLFLTLLGVGFVLAEATLSQNINLSRHFYEYKDFVVSTCGSGSWTEKIDLCQAYESLEAMLVRPDDYARMMKHREESGEPNSSFKRLSLMFRRSMSSRKHKSLGEWPAFLAN